MVSTAPASSSFFVKEGGVTEDINKGVAAVIGVALAFDLLSTGGGPTPPFLLLFAGIFTFSDVGRLVALLAAVFLDGGVAVLLGGEVTSAADSLASVSTPSVDRANFLPLRFSLPSSAEALRFFLTTGAIVSAMGAFAACRDYI